MAAAIAVAACFPQRGGGVDPMRAELARSAPDSFRVRFETTRGAFEVVAYSRWAPVGVDRFYELVRLHYYDDVAFFRVPKNFVAQFGISGDPAISKVWQVRRIGDDTVRRSNARGTMAFARGGPATRTVQLFVSLRDNARLDTLLNGFGFPPIAQVVSGMEVVDSLYSGYGESAPRTGPVEGRSGPSQDSISALGNAYLRRGWPKLDYVKTARIVQEWRAPR